jgi:ankyrin repeat protein
MPSSIRKALNELPITLDDTYTRALECIPREKWRHAHRLFQCLIAAIRPLRVEELGEIFAIEFDLKGGHRLVENWRPLDAEDAVLSACSSLISIVDVKDSKVVQFSHFSVKEFLTSDRLASSNIGMISRYHVPLRPAHGILARACLTVLLQLDKKTDKKQLGTFPLAFYSSENWMDHVWLGKVTPEIKDAIIRLFDPKDSHLDAVTWMYYVYIAHARLRSIYELEEHPPPLSGTALHFAAYCGFSWLVEHLINHHAEDVDAKWGHCMLNGTPLHAAYFGRRAAAKRTRSDGAEVNSEIEDESRIARHDAHLEVMRVLLESGADVDARASTHDTVLHLAADYGDVEVLQLLVQYKTDINARGYDDDTPLLAASKDGRVDAVQFLLQYGADVDAQDENNDTPLIIASERGYLEVVRLLLGNGADMHFQNVEDQTALQAAKEYNHHEIAQLLLDHGAEGEDDRDE